MYEPIAIIGCGCLYPPDSFSVDKLYENVVNGVEGIRDIDKFFWEPEKYYDPDHSVPDKTYCRKSGYLDHFDVSEESLCKIRLPKEEYDSFNRTQKMILHTILQAMSSAQVSLEDLKEGGLFVGNMLGDPATSDFILREKGEAYLKLAERRLTGKTLSSEQVSWKEEFNKELTKKFKGNVNLKKTVFPSSLAATIADVLKLEKLSMVVDGACSGGLIVIDEAIKCMHQNKVNMCIVSGVLGNMGVSGNVAFSKIGGLSDKGSVPLDKSANGLTPSEGAGSIIIKKLSDAMSDGNPILGVIRGSGVASDGGGQSIYAPSSRGQRAAMRKSLDRANMTMQDIDYIEMHATGTRIGDKVEVESILDLCKEDDIKNPIAIGSVKAQIGHSFSGAGMANLFKVLLSMKHEILPPTHKFTALHEEIGDISRYVYVNHIKKAWVQPTCHPRRALVNAFGFGGINANILLEEFDHEYHKKLLSELKTGKDSLRNRNFAVVSYGYFEDEYNERAIHSNEKESGKTTNHKSFPFPFIKFKIPPRILNKLDEAQRISLLAVSNALERENITLTKEKTGVFAGSVFGLKNAYNSDIRIRTEEYSAILRALFGDTFSEAEYQEINEEFKNNYESIEEDTLPGFMDNIVAGRIANYYDTQGINAAYDMDIGSFAAALHQGLLSLNNYENDAIIVGAANCNDLDEFHKIYHAAGSKSNKVRKGACFFIMKREEDVKQDEKVYAYITIPEFKKSASKVYNDNVTDYAGATEAFGLLDHIIQLSSEKKSIHHISASLTGRSFTYDIIPFQSGTGPLCSEEYFTYYTDETDLSQIIQSLEIFRRQKQIPETSRSSKSQAAIIFKDFDELETQINFLKTLEKM